MKSFLGTLVIGVIVIGAMFGMFWIGTYGSLNAGSQDVQAKSADIDSVLQRRADLIPNLVETVKGYAAHEKGVFVAVTEARSKVGSINMAEAVNDPAKMKAFKEAQAEMSGALSRLLVVAERYPELKANENFLNLQSQLEGTENRIAVARKTYNDTVKPYNTTVNGFFAHFVANVHGFRKAEYFQADEGAKTAPKVKF